MESNRYDYDYYITDGDANFTMEYHYPEQKTIIDLCKEIAKNESLARKGNKDRDKTSDELKNSGLKLEQIAAIKSV